MSVIPTVYNQGTGLIGSTSSGTTVPENVDNLIVNQNLLVGGTGTFNGPVTVNSTLTVSGTISFADVNITGIFTVVNMSASGFVLVAGEVRGDTLVSDTSITAGTTITAGDSVTGSAFRATLFSSNSVCFFSSTGQIDFNNNFTYNTGTNTLSVVNLSATDITATDITATDITATDITATNITVADITASGNITVADILASGNISATNFTASGNITASSGIITGNSYVCNTNIQLNEVNPGNPGTQNRIIFNDIGTIEARRDSGGKRQFDLVNRNAGITFQIRLQEDVNYYNVPAGGCHCFYIDTVRVAELERANPLTTFTLEEGIMSYDTSSNDYIIRNGYASQVGFAVNMQSDGTLQLQGDGQGGATGGIGVRVFTRESAGKFERLRITNTIIDARLPVQTREGIGSTLASRFQLPASAPGGNNWLLRVLDSTATPPTTEWYNPGSSQNFDYVSYDTNFSTLVNNVPGSQPSVISNLTAANIGDTSTLNMTSRKYIVNDTVSLIPQNGELVIDGTYGLRFDHPDGFLFRLSNQWKLQILATTSTIYTDLNLNKASGRGNLTVEGTSTFEDNITVANGGTITLTDNASSISLLTGSIFNHATNVYMGFRGQYTTGVDYNIAIWDDGHVRYKARGSTGHRFDVIDPTTSTTDQVLNVNFTTVDVYKNLNIRGNAQIQADNDFTFLEASQTAAGDKGVIFWPNIGRLIGRRTGALEAEIQLVNAVARNTVDFQLSCQENKTLINTPNVGGTGAVDIRVNNFQTLLVEAYATTVKNFLRVDQVAVPSVDEELPLLLRREADDIIFKTQTLTTTYNPTSDTLSANRFVVADAVRYSSASGSVPINYTLAIGPVNSFFMVDVAGTTSNGYYGLGTYLSMTRSGKPTYAYGDDADYWTWTDYVIPPTGTPTPTYWVCQSPVAGLWHIRLSFLYINFLTGNTDRVNPIIKLERNGTVLNYGYESHYIRNQFGIVGNCTLDMKLRFLPNDLMAFRSYLNIGPNSNFSDVATGFQYGISNIYLTMTFLGPLDEYNRTPP